MPNTPPRKKLIKAVIIGDEYVGKTQLMKRLCKNSFQEKYIATIGTDFLTYNYFNNEQNSMATVQCWDTAGQERFRVLGDTFYKRADILLCAIDLTTKEGLDVTKLNATINNAIRLTDNTEVAVLIVGTKADSSKETITITRDALMEYIKNNAEKIPALLPTVVLTDASENTGFNELRNTIADTMGIGITPTLNVKIPLDKAIEKLERATDNNKNKLAQELINFRNQINLVKLDDESKSLCNEAVENAVNAFCFNRKPSDAQKKSALTQLHLAANLSPSVRKVKALAICMMVIGALLAGIGGLALAMGVFVPIGAIGVAGGVAMMGAGICLFEKRHKIFNPLGSVNKIENMLKKQQ